MLQWMGGSRRKVTTSRKSTQNRQKQYFEQRKRQHQAPGLEPVLSGRNKQDHYQEKPRSLDILSLINLSSAAQEQSSSPTNARRKPEVSVGSLHSHVLECSPASSANEIIPGDFGDQKETNTRSSVHEPRTQPPEKVHLAICLDDDPPPSCDYSANRFGDGPDEWKISTENQSLLDLVSKEGCHHRSEGRSVPEAHVAFSVKGLGKMGTATPVHSPEEKGYKNT